MSRQLLTMLFLASLAQEKNERRPIAAPPARGHVVNVRVGIGREIRQITLSMPDPADEPPAPRNIPFNILTSVVDPENFDRWLFADDQSGAGRHRHLDDILRSRVDAAIMANKLTDSQRTKLRLAGRGDIKRLLRSGRGQKARLRKGQAQFQSRSGSLEAPRPAHAGLSGWPLR